MPFTKSKISCLKALFIGTIVFSPSCWAVEKLDLPTTSTTFPTTHAEKHRDIPMSKPRRLQDTLWWRIAKLHELDPYILYAVALVESAKNGNDKHHGNTNTVTPWPWALNKSGQAFIPESEQEAHALLKKSIAEGHRSIDVGLMQINLHWHGNKVNAPEQLLNPVTNLQIGAGLLAEAIQSSPDNLVLGIGRYHSWQNIHAAEQYGRRVLAVADQIRTVI